MADNKQSDNGWNEWSKFVLKELERLNDDIDTLYSKLEEINASKEMLDTVKAWKLKVESITTFEDLRQMKENVSEFQKFKTQVITALIVIQTLFGVVMALLNYFL